MEEAFSEIIQEIVVVEGYNIKLIRFADNTTILELNGEKLQYLLAILVNAEKTYGIKK